jgi:MFS family permease
MPEERPASYGEVFAVVEYRYLFASNLLSLLGDQLSKVALTFLVFHETRSAGLAATAFAVSYLPWLVGGPTLAAYADRFARRSVLVVCDLLRAVLVAAMLLPGLDSPVLIGLLFLANFLRPPFVSARAAMMPEVLEGDRYPVGAGVDNVVVQATQVLGFVVGGALVSLFSPRGALLIDVLTFLVSAGLIAYGVSPRPAAGAPQGSAVGDFARAVAYVFGNPVLRGYLLLFWVASAFVYGVEGLAAPLADHYGGGPIVGGLVLAAAPLGVTVGGVVLTRLCPAPVRLRLIFPLAVTSCLVLLPVWWKPPLEILLVLLVLAGLGGSFSIVLAPLFGRAVSDEIRGRAFGVAVAGVSAAQGLAVVLAGLMADHLAVTTVIGLSGILGTAAVLALAPLWPHWSEGGRLSRTAAGTRIPLPRQRGARTTVRGTDES